MTFILPNRDKKHWPTCRCEACGFTAPLDVRWPTLCWQCADKIRKIDFKAESPGGIRMDMIEGDIPIGRQRNKVV